MSVTSTHMCRACESWPFGCLLLLLFSFVVIVGSWSLETETVAPQLSVCRGVPGQSNNSAIPKYFYPLLLEPIWDTREENNPNVDFTESKMRSPSSSPPRIGCHALVLGRRPGTLGRTSGTGTSAFTGRPGTNRRLIGWEEQCHLGTLRFMREALDCRASYLQVSDESTGEINDPESGAARPTSYDVIVDCTNLFAAQYRAVQHFWTRLAPGGVYYIQGVGSSYTQFPNNPTQSTMEFLKDLAQMVLQQTTPSELDTWRLIQSIQAITFTPRFVAISKSSRTNLGLADILPVEYEICSVIDRDKFTVPFSDSFSSITGSSPNFILSMTTNPAEGWVSMSPIVKWALSLVDVMWRRAFLPTYTTGTWGERNLRAIYFLASGELIFARKPVPKTELRGRNALMLLARKKQKQQQQQTSLVLGTSPRMETTTERDEGGDGESFGKKDSGEGVTTGIEGMKDFSLTATWSASDSFVINEMTDGRFRWAHCARSPRKIQKLCLSACALEFPVGERQTVCQDCCLCVALIHARPDLLSAQTSSSAVLLPIKTRVRSSRIPILSSDPTISLLECPMARQLQATIRNYPFRLITTQLPTLSFGGGGSAPKPNPTSSEAPNSTTSNLTSMASQHFVMTNFTQNSTSVASISVNDSLPSPKKKENPPAPSPSFKTDVCPELDLVQHKIDEQQENPGLMVPKDGDYRIIVLMFTTGSPENECPEHMFNATAFAIGGADELLTWNHFDFARTIFYRKHLHLFLGDGELKRGGKNVLSAEAGSRLWLPYILHQALKHASPKDFVVYVEGSPLFRNGFEYGLQPLTNWLSKNNEGIIAGQLVKSFTGGSGLGKMKWSVWERNPLSMALTREWIHLVSSPNPITGKPLSDTAALRKLITKYHLKLPSLPSDPKTATNAYFVQDINTVLLKPLHTSGRLPEFGEPSE